MVAVALVVKSVGMHAPRPARDGSHAERLGISVIPKWHPNSSAYWTPVSLRIADDAAVRPAGLERETVGAATRDEDRAFFEERYSFKERLASFGDRFVGVSSSIRRAAVIAVKTELVLLQHAPAADEMATSASLTAGTPAAAPPPVVSPSANSVVRAPRVRQASLSPPSSPDGRNRTAIYDISAQVVYLPSGRRLEAHSGLGSYMDDPRYVHVKRKGATPPNTYRLTLRENLFHGVQAIRLTPVGGNMFGRDGMLVHHYLLGPSGQSNGCVSLADYPAFLNAYLNGEIDRLVVVERLDNPPGQMIAAGWLEKAFKGFFKNLERGSGT